MEISVGPPGRSFYICRDGGGVETSGEILSQSIIPLDSFNFQEVSGLGFSDNSVKTSSGRVIRYIPRHIVNVGVKAVGESTFIYH